MDAGRLMDRELSATSESRFGTMASISGSRIWLDPSDRQAVPDNRKAALTDIDHSFRPASYWPAGDPPDDGVVLVSVELKSTLSDVIRVTAKPTADGRIQFEAYDDNETSFGVDPNLADQPLTFAQLIRLIDGAEFADDAPGLVYGPLAYNSFAGSGTAADAAFVDVTSDQYPQLAEYYERQALAWVMG